MISYQIAAIALIIGNVLLSIIFEKKDGPGIAALQGAMVGTIESILLYIVCQVLIAFGMKT